MSHCSTACAWETLRMQSWYSTRYNKLRSFLFGKSKRRWATALVSPSNRVWTNSIQIDIYRSIGMFQCWTGPSSNHFKSTWNATHPAIQLPRVHSISISITVLYCTVQFSSVSSCWWNDCNGRSVWRLADQPYNPHRTEVEALSMGLVARVFWMISCRHCKLAHSLDYFIFWYILVCSVCKDHDMAYLGCQMLWATGEILNRD